MPVSADRIIQKLEEQKAEEGTLPRLLEFYQKLLQIQSRVGRRISVPNPDLDDDFINKRLGKGKPLIRFEELELDWLLLRDTFQEAITLFADYEDLFGVIPEEIIKSKPGRILTKKLARAWFRGSKLPPTLPGKDISENLITNLIHASFKPFLMSYSTALISMVEQEKWRRGYCPICGGNPDFSFLDMEKGGRWLVCSRCDAEWLFQRLQCPYCDCKEQNDLAYYTDNKRLYRLYTCEQCKHYLKAIDLRQAESEVLIPLERLLTLDFDRQAHENGYSSL